MDVMLRNESIPIQSSWCVVRQQQEQYVVYNTKTDELYLLAQYSFYFYELCNGINTINDLVEIFKLYTEYSGDEAKKTVYTFIEKMIARGILEIILDVKQC